MKTIAPRWIDHSPINDIDVGDVAAGGVSSSICPPLKRGRVVTQLAMYSETKAIGEKIINRTALQTIPTYRVGYKRLNDFYEALNEGRLQAFTRATLSSATYDMSKRQNTRDIFPALAQIFEPSDVQLSQLS